MKIRLISPVSLLWELLQLGYKICAQDHPCCYHFESVQKYNIRLLMVTSIDLLNLSLYFNQILRWSVKCFNLKSTTLEEQSLSKLLCHSIGVYNPKAAGIRDEEGNIARKKMKANRTWGTLNWPQVHKI